MSRGSTPIVAASAARPSAIGSPLLDSASGIGRYWTEHLKTEAELAITGQGRLVSFEELESEPRVSRYLYRDHTYKVRTLSLVQAWQFRA